MKITHRQTPPDAERPRRKKQSGAALIAVLAVALVAGIGLVAVLDSMTAPEPTDPERTALLEEQKAFHLLQNYSAERAYGMQKGD